MTIKTLGDVISNIQARSTASVVYTVVAQPTKGNYQIQRNGVNTWSFNFPPNFAGGTGIVNPGTSLWAGAVTDANPQGTQLDITTADGVSSRVDAVQFIQSLN